MTRITASKRKGANLSTVSSVVLRLLLVVCIIVLTKRGWNEADLADFLPTVASVLADVGTANKKLEAQLKIKMAQQEILTMDLHWDVQIEQVREIARNWQEYGFTPQEIMHLFSMLGETLQAVACRGKDSMCFDGASTNHKVSVYLEMEMEHKAKWQTQNPSNQVPVYCETGFNFGKSALAALLAGYKVYSFDVQQHAYSERAASLISTIFPGKFTMTKGNSFETVPKFVGENKNTVSCNVLSIDGLHSYGGVMKDFANFQPITSNNALIFIDDIGPDYSAGSLHKAWKELLETKKITQKKYVHYGYIPTARGPRDFAWGVAIANN